MFAGSTQFTSILVFDVTSSVGAAGATGGALNEGMCTDIPKGNDIGVPPSSIAV